MSTPKKNDASSEFTFAARRDKLAQEYFTSQEFLDQLKAKIEQYLVRRQGFPPEFDYIRKGYAELEHPKVDACKRDMPYLQEAFKKLKKSYPDLDHIRIHEAGSVIVDTKPNTWWRRNFSASGLRGSTPAF